MRVRNEDSPVGRRNADLGDCVHFGRSFPVLYPCSPDTVLTAPGKLRFDDASSFGRLLPKILISSLDCHGNDIGSWQARYFAPAPASDSLMVSKVEWSLSSILLPDADAPICCGEC